MEQLRGRPGRTPDVWEIPQEFLPQLMITFVQYYGITEEEKTPQGARFVDSRRFEGPIPELIKHAEIYVLGAMRKAVLMIVCFGVRSPSIPRKPCVKHLPMRLCTVITAPTCGGYVQIRMFADRLEIQSPGGLFGNVTVENLEEEHSTRNARLMRIMEDMHVAENRGSGISAMLRAMRDANLEPPQFADCHLVPGDIS